jgi:hypothetical protein
MHKQGYDRPCEAQKWRGRTHHHQPTIRPVFTSQLSSRREKKDNGQNDSAEDSDDRTY